MLTGDKKEIGEYVANKIGIDEVYTQLLPIDKVKQSKRINKNKIRKGKLVFVEMA